MSSGARYSGVPQRVAVRWPGSTFFTNPKSAIYSREGRRTARISNFKFLLLTAQHSTLGQQSHCWWCRSSTPAHAMAMPDTKLKWGAWTLNTKPVARKAACSRLSSTSQAARMQDCPGAPP